MTELQILTSEIRQPEYLWVFSLFRQSKQMEAQAVGGSDIFLTEWFI